MEGNTDFMKFEATGGPDGSTWSYKLAIKPNNEFIMNCHHSTESPNDWIYEGKFTPSCYKEFYFLDFSKIEKTYTTTKAKGKGKGQQQVHRDEYTEAMTAEIKPEGTCELKKGKLIVLMNNAIVNNAKQFFEINYPNILRLNDIEMQIHSCKAKNNLCCRLDSQGIFIDCGVPCRGDCCGYLGKLCSDPCEDSKKINEELTELYRKQMESLADDDLNSKLNHMISTEKFEKIVLNRINKIMNNFSNCVHNWDGYSWVTCCQFCKIKNVYGSMSKKYNEAQNSLKIGLGKKYFSTINSNFMVCNKCPYQICVYCKGIYDINILKKVAPLHKHDLLSKTEENYNSTCNLCEEKIDRPYKRCEQCYISVCWVCYANYEKLVGSLTN